MESGGVRGGAGGGERGGEEVERSLRSRRRTRGNYHEDERTSKRQTALRLGSRTIMPEFFHHPLILH